MGTINLPDGWPVSLWFFIIAALVFLLQLFPYTGIFLMIVAGAFWSVLLINLGMAGLVVEVATLRISPLWLAVPALYAGGYYVAYTRDQLQFAKLSADTIRFNEGKALRFDPDRQDLLFQAATDGLSINIAQFVEEFGLPRAFDSRGQVAMIGTGESCALIREHSNLFLSAGIQGHPITRKGRSEWKTQSTGFCTIYMKGSPDKAEVWIEENALKQRYGWLPATLREITALDKSTGKSATVRMGRASPLMPFPMPYMGCALDSGTPAWRCFAGFVRGSRQVIPGMARYEGAGPLLARVLGLSRSDDLAKHAVGIERFKPMADKADADLVAKEVAVLERVLADPLAPIKDSYFSHIPKKPEVIAPFAARIIAALQSLQSADHRGAAHGRDLWQLVAALPEEALEPHRAEIVAMMQPGSVKPWTLEEDRICNRLDAARADERALLLDRIESHPYGSGLFPSFCRMGTAVPPDAKQRLLAHWRKLGAARPERDRPMEQVPFYLALARMGLKAEAGKVEQRYYGPVYRGIWAEVTPDTPADICDLDHNEIFTRFRDHRG